MRRVDFSILPHQLNLCQFLKELRVKILNMVRGKNVYGVSTPTNRGDISFQLIVDAQGRSVPHRRDNIVNQKAGERAVPNPNSGVIWSYREFDINLDGKISFPETMHRSVAGPAIKNDLLFIADFSGLLHCLDAKTGKQHWNYDLFAASWAIPLIAGDRVYVVDEDGDVAVFDLSANPKTSGKDQRTISGEDDNVLKREING